jgi:hypothetical protein
MTTTRRPTLTSQVADLKAENARLAQELADSIEASAKRLLEINDAAQRRAVEAGYCWDFDAFMIRTGLKPRKFKYTHRFSHIDKGVIEIQTIGVDEDAAHRRAKKKLDKMIEEVGLDNIVWEKRHHYPHNGYYYDEQDIRDHGIVSKELILLIPDEETKYVTGLNYVRDGIEAQLDADDEDADG